jgi:hypothetical protein
MTPIDYRVEMKVAPAGTVLFGRRHATRCSQLIFQP